MEYPFYRVVSRSLYRTSYCDNSHSKSFNTLEEAEIFAATLKGMIREVQLISGEYKSFGSACFKIKTVAKWGIKNINGKKVIGKIG